MMNWLRKYIDHLGVSVLHFEKSVNTRSTIDKAIKNNSNLRSDILAKIIEVYPDVNPKWLISGEGNMLLVEKDKEYNLDINLNIPSLIQYLLDNNDKLILNENFCNYIRINMKYIINDEKRKEALNELKKLVIKK